MKAFKLDFVCSCICLYNAYLLGTLKLETEVRTGPNTCDIQRDDKSCNYLLPIAKKINKYYNLDNKSLVQLI